MKTGAAFVGFLFSAGVGFAVGWAVGSGDQGATVGGGGSGDPGALAADAAALPVGDSYVKGKNDALVTIIEFSDFECPFCSRVNPTLKQVQDKYGDDVRIVFKHTPLPFHKAAPLASEYALAAGEQGKFWEMHDKIFANQKALQESNLKAYAAELGLDQAKIDAYVKSGKGKKVIADDMALASKVGARGTPNFFVNGEQLTGAQPFPSFEKVIDEQLARAKKKVESGVPRDKVYAALLKDQPPKPAAAPERPAPPPATRQKIELVDSTPKKGGDNPLVTIVEFSDFECPFCSRVNPTLAQVMKEYGDKVQIRFRNQPLPFHKRAVPAAQAALAAHEQGKFWQMHDKLFENAKALQDADLERYAKEIGLNVAKFKKDMASPKIAKIIAQDQADGSKWGARGTPTFFVNGVPVRGAQPFAAFKTAIDKEIELANKLVKEGVSRSKLHDEIIKREAGKEVAGEAPGGARPAEPSEPQDVKLGRAPIAGDKNAPVKVVIWSDFECPFCSRVNPSINQIKKEYGDKVVVAFKHFPLPFHKNATRAAVASLAAHRQGKFWEMHDKLFENAKALQESDLEGYAKAIGLDVAKFKKDMQDKELEAWVKQDMAEGSKVGVNGTPATYINGRKVSGAQPFPAFKAIIDEELKKG